MNLTSPKFSYIAISYTWGDTSAEVRKKLYTTDNEVLLITPNLHSCLSRLQHETRSLFLWIDAICINEGADQAALRERSAQIRLMRRIYAEAEEVFVDLGDCPIDDGILLDGLGRMTSVKQKHWKELIASARKRHYRSKDSIVMPRKSFNQEQMFRQGLDNLQPDLRTANLKKPFWQALKDYQKGLGFAGSGSSKN